MLSRARVLVIFTCERLKYLLIYSITLVNNSLALFLNFFKTKGIIKLLIHCVSISIIVLDILKYSN